MSAAVPGPRRVVITGLGVICPLGLTKEDLWDSLQAGRSGVGTLTALPSDSLPTSFAGEARSFTGAIEDFGPLEGEQKKAIRKGLKVMCRESQMGVAAAQRALNDAGITPGKLEPERAGIVFGSDYMMSIPEEISPGVQACVDTESHFDFTKWAGLGMSKMSPLWLLKYLPNMPASHIAIYNDLRGPNNSLTLREAAPNLAIGEAYRVILRDHAEVMIAGATGTRVHPMKAVHAALCEELAGNGQQPAKAARPFDLNRTGMVLGEGAGAVILEELESAKARGATIYGEVIGSGSSSVADRKSVAQRDTALANVIRACLRDAKITPEEVGHIHAHGLSTRTCDVDEARAIRQVFGAAADRVPVTAAKSYFGNLGAGSGIVEVVASLLAFKHDQLFPVLNYETADPECPIFVARPDAKPGNIFLNLNVTPQGQASGVLVKRFVA
jgi:3-oxoacyl-[acyl-carrier-protein] synthase II